MTKPLTESVKADRNEMTRQVTLLAESLGANVTRIEGGEYPGPRAIHLSIETPRGLHVSVSFDGARRQPDTHVLSWNMNTDSPDLLTDAFGNINPHHFSKATHTAGDFSSLAQKLQRGLEMAADGRAFRPAEEVAAIKVASRARYAAMVEKSRKPLVGP